MATTQLMKERIASQEGQQMLANIYGKDMLDMQTSRYGSLLTQYEELFGTNDVRLFSAPGRSEIGGNHTDHNYGKVLAASINLDTIAASAPVSDRRITIVSEGYPGQTVVDLDELGPIEGEGGTTALVRGIAAGFLEFGYHIGGFNAYVSSNVLSASGLSSSASFEMLVSTILSTYYNDGVLDAVMMSRIGQFAENRYWNKPSGMLDQMACAYGGLITIDFKNPAQPVIEPIDYPFRDKGYSLVIVATGGNHADLTADYAAVPNEMFEVARILGGNVCRDITAEQIYENLGKIREQAGDRAVLRALHFLEENRRVDEQAAALRNDEIGKFLTLITESGNSSWKWLQNCYRDSDSREQGITVALALTEQYLRKIGDGACRVHGGGFAGVILAIVPDAKADEYAEFIGGTLGTQTFTINVRQQGAICLAI